MKEFEDFCRSLGLDPTTMTPDQIKRAEALWRLSQTGSPGPAAAVTPSAPAAAGVGKPTAAVTLPFTVPTGAAAVRTQAELELEAATARTEAENQRRADIVALCQRFMIETPDRVREFQDYANLAISGGLSAKDAELEFLRRSYKNGPLAYSPSAPAVDDKVLEVAVARAMGMSRETVEKGYDDKTLSAADRQFKGGCGLQRLVVLCARANGYREAESGDFVGIGSTKRILQAAFRDGPADEWGARASSGFGPSTYNLSGILSNVMNKSIRDYFNAVEAVWRIISATRPVNDFKEISGYALTGDLTYKKVAPGGEVKHGTLGEESYGNKADLYALMLGIDYQHLRNDDLGAFNAINKRLGRGGALTINDVFWLEWLAGHGTFWAAANQNYANGADYAFTLANMDNVNLAWQVRTDPNGKPMGDKARYLLTPSKWELKGKRFMGSPRVSNDSGSGEDNPVAGMWEPISSTYLGNANFTGYSVDDYYLVKDPADMPVIETVFLDGQEMPTIEMAEPDLSRLGIMVRGMHGFGCRKQEKRGAHKFRQT